MRRLNEGRLVAVTPAGGDFVNTLFQPRWRAWVVGAILLAVAIVVVLVIAYSGGGSGGSGGGGY
jgi:hypothetical protein